MLKIAKTLFTPGIARKYTSTGMTMVRACLCAICLCCLQLSAVAQRGNTGNQQAPPNVVGRVISASTKEPVEFASIGAYLLSDSSLVNATTADATGKFALRLRPGQYYLDVQFISFTPKRIEMVNVARGEVTRIGTVSIAPSIQQLDEVTIQAEKTQMEMTLDKKVYNIGKDLSNLGGSATDILDNLPSVQVDVEGNVSLRGSDNVRILIDGKPSGLVGLSSNDALRQLNANLVERVEIITNPSARYDAEGQAGIINIVLKKQKRAGINGSFQLNTGWPHNHGASASVNYRKKWVNFFTNLGLGYRQNPGKGDAWQAFGNPVTLITERDRKHVRGGLNYSTRFGADFYLSEKSSITTSFLYRYSDEDNTSTISYYDRFTSNVPDSLTIRKGSEIAGDQNLQYAINFTQKFEKKGQQFTADFQFQDNSETESMDLIEQGGAFSAELSPILFQRSGNDEQERRIMAQSDYTHPFGKKGKLELGTRYTDRLVGNDYLVEEKDKQGIYQVNHTLSNDFEYREQVFAVYAIVSNTHENLSWQLGTRYEATDLTTELKTTQQKNTQRYRNLFPSAFMTYKLTEKHSLQASYSRRIRRPRGRSLNPFYSISDSRNFFTGNPNLKPVFTDSYELGYLLNTKKSSFYAGLFGRFSQGVYQRLRITIDGITYTQPYNISKREDMGLELNLSHEFANWYRVNGNVNLFRSFTEGGSVAFQENTTSFEPAIALTASGRMSNNFRFKDLFNAQINVTYRAPRNSVQGKRYSITAIDIGLSKDIFKGKGTIALNVRDLLNTRKYRGETITEGYYEKSSFQWRSRTTQLSITYRLNQKKQTRRRRNMEGVEDAEGF